MSRDVLKAVCAFLAGLLVTACVLGYWVGRTVPTAAQVDTLIEQTAETNFLLRAHGITWEALNYAKPRTDLAAPADLARSGGAPGDDPVGAGNE